MRFIPLLAALMLVSAPVMAQTPEVSKATTLDISAEANVKAEPDMAIISAGVITNSKTAEAAMKENATKMTAIFAALKKAGIADKDRQTSGITVNPQYVYKENQSPTISGYNASNSVNVTLRDLKAIGPVLDTLISQGANNISGPNFSVENPEELLNGARKEAVEKARKRAEVYAAATGLKIAKIRSISENSNIGYPQPVMMMARAKMEMAGDASTPVASGQVNLNVNVNISYELE